MEKRAYRRAGYHVEATLLREGESYPCETEDLSLHGMFVRTEAPVQVDNKVEVDFRLTGTTEPITVRCPGKIVRADSRGVGIEFLDMDVDSFVELRNIVALNSGDPDEISEEFSNMIQSRLSGEQ